MHLHSRSAVLLFSMAVSGCASPPRDGPDVDALPISPYATLEASAAGEPGQQASPDLVRQASFAGPQEPEPLPPVTPDPVEERLLRDARPLRLEDVVESVYRSHPLVESAVLSRVIAEGDQLSAWGAFDLNLKSTNENAPLGFYKTYRQSAGFEQPLFGGASVFGNYHIGRGSFQPWFLNRQTNGGGEFKAGVLAPLLRNRDIDERRAELWRRGWARRQVEPLIRAEFIEFVRAASIAYWQWLAAGQAYQVADELLQLAVERTQGLKRRVAAGDLPQIELTDNERLIVSRQAKQIDARRKLEQSAIKLSLFFRDAQGRPVVPPRNLLPPEFPPAREYNQSQLFDDIPLAQRNRPELASLEFLRRQIDVDLAQAANQLLPEVNAGVVTSKDVGAPTSFRNYKAPLELEGGLYVNVPIQRRKARGKIQALEAKRGQVLAKQRFTSDKITTDVRNAAVAVVAAQERIEKNRRSVALAKTMARAERRKFDLGDSDLFLVNQREQQQADAALLLIESLLEYFEAQADYRAALGIDRVREESPKTP